MLALLTLEMATAFACGPDVGEIIVLPPDGTANMPPDANITAIVSGKFAGFSINVVDANGDFVPNDRTVKEFVKNTPEPGGLMVVTPTDPLEPGTYTVDIGFAGTIVETTTFTVTTEVVRPIENGPLVEIVDVSEVSRIEDECGERPMRLVTADVWPSVGDPLGLSYVEVHLMGENEGLGADTLYTAIPALADVEPTEVEIEVFAGTAPRHNLSARQFNGLGEESTAATFVDVGDFIVIDTEDDEGGCFGCNKEADESAVWFLLPLVMLAHRRRI